MKSNRILVILLIGSISLPSFGQRRQGSTWNSSGQPPQSQQQQQGRSQQDRRGGHQQLGQAKDNRERQGNSKNGIIQILSLPEKERMGALEKTPGFALLSPEEQGKLRRQLNELNRLSPEAQKKIIGRLKILGSLTPEQRQLVWQLNGRLHQLPIDSRQRVILTVSRLRQMSFPDRQKFYGSDQFRNLSSEEQLIVRGLSDLGHEAADDAEE